MISVLKKEIAERLHLPEDTISLSCFFHGTARPDRKLLFLATDGKKPLCLVKVIRDAEYNAFLEKERLAQEAAHSLPVPFSVPAVLFSGVVHGCAMYAESVAPGVPLGKREAVAFIPNVLAYQKAVPRGAPISLKLFCDFLKTQSTSDTEVLALVEVISRVTSLFGGWSHGDFTYMNIVRSGHHVTVIDWERFNERPVWGIDFAHYVLRSRALRGKEAAETLAQSFASALELSPEHVAALFALDEVLDIVQKRYPELYGTARKYLVSET